MPSRAKKIEREVAKLPSLPKDLVSLFLTGPMTGEAINEAGNYYMFLNLSKTASSIPKKNILCDINPEPPEIEDPEKNHILNCKNGKISESLSAHRAESSGNRNHHPRSRRGFPHISFGHQ